MIGKGPMMPDMGEMSPIRSIRSLDGMEASTSDREESTQMETTQVPGSITITVAATIIALWRMPPIKTNHLVTNSTATPQIMVPQQSEPPTQQSQLSTQQSQPLVSHLQLPSQQVGTNTWSLGTIWSATQHPMSSYHFSLMAGMSHIQLFAQQPPMFNPYCQKL